jgi:hypothetical protein
VGYGDTSMAKWSPTDVSKERAAIVFRDRRPSTLEDESDMFLRNVSDDLHNDIASDPSRLESSIVPLWKPKNSQSDSFSVNEENCLFLWNAKSH